MMLLWNSLYERSRDFREIEVFRCGIDLGLTHKIVNEVQTEKEFRLLMTNNQLQE